MFSSFVVTALFFALGTIVGSFIGVVAERIHTGQSWKTGRSRCNSCRRNLAALDLIPIVSWLVSGGRCRTCSSRIPGLYVLYEFCMGAGFAAAYYTLGSTPDLIVFLGALTVLGFITVYDMRHTIVLPKASALFIIFALGFLLLHTPSTGELVRTLWYSAGIGLFFYLTYFFSRGRAMGLGDTPISIGLSFLVGSSALAGFLFSFWIGGVIGMLILVFRKGGPTMGIEVPFVPFMALGFLLAFFTQWNPLPF